MENVKKPNEFRVSVGDETIGPFDGFNLAAAVAVQEALVSNNVEIEVLVFHEGGANTFGGPEAVEEFRQNPGREVFRRYAISAKQL